MSGHNPDDMNMVKVIYVLLLLTLLFPVTGLIAVIMAHVNANEASEPMLSHYRFQYRTFWIALLVGIVGSVTTVVGVGFLLLVALLVWYLVRNIKGLVSANKHEPLALPERWGL